MKLEWAMEVVATSADAGQIPHPGGQGDLVPLDQLIRDTFLSEDRRDKC